MKAENQEELSKVIGQIYDAALSTDSWPDLLQRHSEVLGEIGILLYVRDLKAEEVPTPEGGEGNGGEAQKFHLTIKVNASELSGDGASPKVAGDQSMIPSESIILGCFVSRDRPTGSLIAIQPAKRRKAAAHFDGDPLRQLAPHLRRSFELHNQFLTLRMQQAATKHVLDHFPVGVVLVDARGRVLTMNSSAAAIIELADGIGVDRLGLRADTGQETASLRALVANAARAGNGRDTERGGAMTLSRPSHLRPLWVLVAPLVGNHGAEESVPAVVALFVSDPDRRHEIPTEALERFFGLTPAEVRLLEALVNGKSLEEASEEFQVSKNTLRTQLHQIFRKTDTSRQSEVIKLVLSTPVQLHAPSEHEH
jgi:DNA-binding CsgD family transcriptional regulator